MSRNDNQERRGPPPEPVHSGPVSAEVLAPGHTFATVTDKISSIVLTRRTPLYWLAGLGFALLLVMVLLTAITYLMGMGVGIYGVRIPVGWGFDIVNFVWWIGIGHAGTLISAILLLLRQQWRTSVNRFAEAMTLFAVACAGMFPLLHMGRPWLFYWLLPYLNSMQVWPQFRSPLVWDVFAVSTYGTVSLIFWYVGLMPDVATLRDKAESKIAKVIYGIMAFGWRGSARHWHRYESAYLLLAGLATPLVVSVHTVVSFDFTIGLPAGWHTTIFPPYFVAGAIYSGFAMVLTLAIPIRGFYGLEDFVTVKHLENSAKILLATGLIVTYGYAMEAFMAWYSGDKFEWYMTSWRATGGYRPQYWLLIPCNVVSVQFLWFKRLRRNVPFLFLISFIINLGMWMERYVIVVTSLSRDFVPSAWRPYSATIWDYATYIGTIGFFFACFFLFLRLLPMIAIFEMRELVAEAGAGKER